MTGWLPDLSDVTLLRALGWAMPHFLIQGTTMVFGSAVGLWWLRRSSAHARYRVALLTLLVCILVPAIGVVRFCFKTEEMRVPPHVLREPTVQWGNPEGSWVGFNRYGILIWSLQLSTGSTRILRRLLPVLAVVWMVGCGWLALRLRRGWTVCLWCRHRALPAPAHLQAVLVKVARELGITRVPPLRVSHRINSPMLLGVVHPAIVLPAPLEETFTAEELELLLAHELAHHHRGHHWHNALQCCAEIFVFWHPAVLWLCHRVRHERELCCDEQAAQASAEDRVRLATALAALREARFCVDAPALGANSGSLLHRVKTLLQGEWPPRPQRLRQAVVLAILPVRLLSGFIMEAGVTSPVVTTTEKR